MSLGSGTLANPHAFKKGTRKAARSNGKQHTLPQNPHTDRIFQEDVEPHWSPKQPKTPTRLWGTVKPVRGLGGEVREDGVADFWSTGEYWNVDSNIRKWGEHEVRRNAASAAHDVHRHDQYVRIVLPPQPGEKKQRPERSCVSGVVSPADAFLEAWGFDLGLRDRQARPTKMEPSIATSTLPCQAEL